MTILAYHSISADWDDPLAVDPSRFARQMELAAKRRVLELTHYVDLLRAGRLPRKAVAITFDDGYADNLDVALPMCRRLGIRPTLFLAVRHMDDGTPLGWRGDGRKAEVNMPLDWDQVRYLAAEGWTIGSHTRTHRDLVAATDEQLIEELSGSRDRISSMLGMPCKLLSYPYGSHNARVRKAAAGAGYDAAFTLPTGREYHDLAMALPRIGVFRDDPLPVFWAKLSGPALELKLRLRRPRVVKGSAGARDPLDA